MLRLPPFELRQATTTEEAVAILAGEGPTARVVAGGTDLWPNMKRRHQQAQTVISLMGISGLRGISNGSTDREVRLGATTLLSDLVADETLRRRYPALVRAVASISSPPLRNMGTIGGNVCLDTRCTYYNQTEPWRQAIDYCMKEAGSVCWVAPSSPRCWAHAASDAAPMLSALDARVVLQGPEGERTIPMWSLYRDDGIDYLTKKPEELVTAILLPPEGDHRHCGSAFWKLRRRGSIDFAVLSVAVAVWPGPGSGKPVDRARIVLGAVGSQPVSADDAAAALVGRSLSEET
ncbi:MAG: FAD binding domain-containing protein, partial [Acidobacteriota bacterium]